MAAAGTTAPLGESPKAVASPKAAGSPKAVASPSKRKRRVPKYNAAAKSNLFEDKTRTAEKVLKVAGTNKNGKMQNRDA